MFNVMLKEAGKCENEKLVLMPVSWTCLTAALQLPWFVDLLRFLFIYFEIISKMWFVIVVVLLLLFWCEKQLFLHNSKIQINLIQRKYATLFHKNSYLLNIYLHIYLYIFIY